MEQTLKMINGDVHTIHTYHKTYCSEKCVFIGINQCWAPFRRYVGNMTPLVTNKMPKWINYLRCQQCLDAEVVGKKKI